MKKAFSLVELSIVLVIMAMVVGGITAGQSILRNAKLKTITTDFAVYQSAMANFNDRYSELPGDFSHATDVWGEANAIPATCADTASTDKKTCNGDGDGTIEASTGSDEIFRFWQHLANAGMIEGVFTGISTDNADHDRASLGVNVPRSSVDNAGWSIGLVGDTSSPSFFAISDYHSLLFGAVKTNSDTREIVLTPEEAKSIDEKLDDGFPGRGDVSTWVNSFHSNCATTDVATTAVYDLTYDDEACALIFNAGL